MSTTSPEFFEQIRQANEDADWIEPDRNVPELGDTYAGYGVFQAADTQRFTIVVFFRITDILDYDDVSASYAAIGYNRDGTKLWLKSIFSS